MSGTFISWWRGRGRAGLPFLVALFLVSPSSRLDAASLVISELMYHPVNATSGITNGDEYEYLELYNAGPTNFPLSGAQFTAGISYTFTNNVSLAPGAYLVVVKNRAAFTNRYPAVANLAATNYTGNLANNGERVTLRNSANEILFSVAYGTDGAWPWWPDGHGSSLQLVNFEGHPDDPASWCAGSRFNGTPGATGDCAYADIVINELLAHTDAPQEDAIELYNTTDAPVDISGWYFSDRSADRKMYRITNTVVAARSFKVFYEYQFQTNALFDTNNTPFELSSDRPESLYLTAADASSNLTRIVDVRSFEASENGVPFGLYPNGTGQFVALDRLTLGTTNPPTLAVFRSGLGATNSGPKVGPVVISEIMYHPANNSAAEEYLELLNLTTNPVPLYLGTNGWKLTTAVNFTFPTNAVIAPTQSVLVVGTTNLPAFRAVYNLPGSIPIYGAWSGVLDNAGESVRLYRPDTPNVDGFVPYILVDRVDYSDVAPWPTAPDGGGPSLERMVNTNLGNVAANWFAGTPGGSPGVAPAGGLVNPTVTPAAPVNGQTFTVTVTVVSQTLPTQVVLRTSINGVVSNRVMRDDGVAPDSQSGDRVYAASLAAPTNGWVYYQFLAYSGGSESFRQPSMEKKFLGSPSLSIGDCNFGVFTTVQPVEQWKTFQVTAPVGNDNCFYFYLNAAGQALVDDVQMRDAGGTNHLLNSGFNASLSSWTTGGGNHSGSVWENPADEGTNGVIRVVATGAGNASGCFQCSIRQGFTPNMSVGQTATLTFQTRAVSYFVQPWNMLLVGSAPQDIVINEIMYHPVETNELPYEYIELHNPTASPVDVTDWILSGVGNFRFPTGSVIAAGGYLVAAGGSNEVATKYGISNVVGDWTGNLRNGGEKITLYNPFGRAVDEVDYDDDEPWPVPADGFGPSLERLNPFAPGNTSINWLASFASTGWRQVIWTGTVAAANDGIRFHLDFDGMCWIDDVSVRPVGSTNDLVVNGGFESGMTGWSATGNHARSRVHAGQGRTGAALALFGNTTRWTQPQVNGVLELQGDPRSNCVISAALPTTNAANYVVSWWVRRERLAQNVIGVLDGRTNHVFLGSHGTPGAANSTATSNAPIQILNVTAASPVLPGTTNIVRARIAPGGLVSNVTLRYRTVGAGTYRYTDRDYSNLTMRDDGIAPDTVAADGEFAVSVPTPTSNWQLVRFQIFAAASNGYSARTPATDDPSLDHGFWVQNGSQQSNIPNWYIFEDAGPVIYPINTRCCAIAPNGQIFTDVELRHRGRPSSTTTNEGATRTGLALRMHNGRAYNAWFGSGQEGINFRSRSNDFDQTYTRLISEPLAYGLQRQLGFPAPALRPVVVWFDGNPSITTELEAPQEDFLSRSDLPASDYLSRAGYTGRRIVGGDQSLDDFDVMKAALLASAPSSRNDAVRTRLWYESMQHVVAFLSAVGDGDQYMDWNMFQHRRSSDGRWTQYPWDLDICFDLHIEGAISQTTNMHPYYQTVLHPSIWDTNFYALPGQALFHPESGAGAVFTLPYRHRQQATLWRMSHTWFTTNVINPRVDALVTNLLPVFTQLGTTPEFLTNKAATIKEFVQSRRGFLMNQPWSDKNTSLWSQVYNPSNVVISEIMYSPPYPGGEYLELFNPGTQFLDLSFWHIRSGAETYNLPYGTMLGPTSFLIVADTQRTLTNAYVELSDPASMIERYPGYKLWDFPIVFTAATEYASRLIEVDALTLPNTGATIQVLDAFSNLMDVVSYAPGGAWPVVTGTAIEVIQPLADNNVGTNWRASRIVGTPGTRNAATADLDNDGMNDEWEMQIVLASGGGIPSIQGVLPQDDFDGDGLSNGEEFVLGTNPTTPDSGIGRIRISQTNAFTRVEFDTVAATGTVYDLYAGRFYSLDRSTNAPGPWTVVPSYSGLPAGGPVTYTNVAPPSLEFFRFQAELRPKR